MFKKNFQKYVRSFVTTLVRHWTKELDEISQTSMRVVFNKLANIPSSSFEPRKRDYSNEKKLLIKEEALSLIYFCTINFRVLK
eukprot:snap_masked-scaffold_64-processed-gene-0.28-mRNA-1 protein AED:1.00 eAED:1.00 QI:0/0/0/0/1/1/2/0/82